MTNNSWECLGNQYFVHNQHLVHFSPEKVCTDIRKTLGFHSPSGTWTMTQTSFIFKWLFYPVSESLVFWGALRALPFWQGSSGLAVPELQPKVYVTKNKNGDLRAAWLQPGDALSILGWQYCYPKEQGHYVAVRSWKIDCLLCSMPSWFFVRKPELWLTGIISFKSPKCLCCLIFIEIQLTVNYNYSIFYVKEFRLLKQFCKSNYFHSKHSK